MTLLGFFCGVFLFMLIFDAEISIIIPRLNKINYYIIGFVFIPESGFGTGYGTTYIKVEKNKNEKLEFPNLYTITKALEDKYKDYRKITIISITRVSKKEADKFFKSKENDQNTNI